MKKMFLILAFLFALSTAFSSNKLSIANIELSDSQIYPGQSGTISFEIKNLESTDLTNVRVIPNSLLSMSPQIINMGTMKP
ncbi:MAG: hypothetical protein PHG04_03405, partial [Candidatus Nanoarchaeia archaeon]|nr:hypothetical protein [Candidatus Nanoarchaeia archaeon]